MSRGPRAATARMYTDQIEPRAHSDTAAQREAKIVPQRTRSYAADPK